LPGRRAHARPCPPEQRGQYLPHGLFAGRFTWVTSIGRRKVSFTNWGAGGVRARKGEAMPPTCVRACMKAWVRGSIDHGQNPRLGEESAGAPGSNWGDWAPRTDQASAGPESVDRGEASLNGASPRSRGEGPSGLSMRRSITRAAPSSENHGAFIRPRLIGENKGATAWPYRWPIPLGPRGTACPGRRCFYDDIVEMTTGRIDDSGTGLATVRASGVESPLVLWRRPARDASSTMATAAGEHMWSGPMEYRGGKGAGSMGEAVGASGAVDRPTWGGGPA